MRFSPAAIIYGFCSFGSKSLNVFESWLIAFNFVDLKLIQSFPLLDIKKTQPCGNS